MIEPCWYGVYWLWEKNGSWIKSSWSCGADQIAYLTACGILSLLITCGNLVVIIVYLKTKNKKLRNSQTIYRTSIAFSDLITGTLVVPCAFVSWLSWDSRRYISVVAILTFVTAFVSLLTLLASAFDRLSVVAFPLNYHVQRDRVQKIALAVIAVIWILAFFFASLPFIIRDSDVTITHAGTFWLLTFRSCPECWSTAIPIFLGLIIIVLVFSGVAIFVALKCSSRNVRGRSSSSSGRPRQERKLAVTLCIMIFAFVASVSVSLVCFGISRNGFLWRNHGYHALEGTAVFMFYTNSLWNCLVYSFRSKDFRDEVKKVFLSFFTAMKCTRCHSPNNGPSNRVERQRRLPETAV